MLLTILSGSSRATLAVPTVDDRIDEEDGTITATVATGTDYVVGTPSSAMLTVSDNDTAGITVSQTTGLTTTEAGGQATFTVVLDTEPAVDVVIGVSSSDEDEGTVSPAMLTFTSTDWNTAQPVTVTGVDENVDDGNQAYYTIALAAATSTDDNYAGLDPADVSVSNTDDDGSVEPTITIPAGTTSVTEDMATTFTVMADVTLGSNLTVSVSVTDDDGSTPQEQAATLGNTLVGTGRSAAPAVGGVSTRFQPRLDAPRQGKSVTLAGKEVNIDALLSGDQPLAEALLDWRNVKLVDLLTGSAFELGLARDAFGGGGAGEFILRGRGYVQHAAAPARTWRVLCAKWGVSEAGLRSLLE